MREDIYRSMFEVEDRHWWYSAKRKIIVSLLRRYLPAGRASEPPRVADVGCGCGRLLEELSAARRCVGLDSSPLAVEFCLKRGLDAKSGRLPDNVPLEQGAFDAVILSDVLEHIDDDAAAAGAAAKLVRPGGIIIVTVPAYPFLFTSWDEAHGHKRRYTKAGLMRALAATGLAVELLSYYNTFLFPAAVAGRAAKKILGIPGTAELALPPPWLNAPLYAIFASERHLLGRIWLPWGLSLIAVLRRH